jgi:hypothetical protein
MHTAYEAVGMYRKGIEVLKIDYDRLTDLHNTT